MSENKNPIEFLNKEEAANEAEKMKKLMDALMFGVPTLAEKLSCAFEKHGLEGLRLIDNTLDKYVVIGMIFRDELTFDINEIIADSDEESETDN